MEYSLGPPENEFEFGMIEMVLIFEPIRFNPIAGWCLSLDHTHIFTYIYEVYPIELIIWHLFFYPGDTQLYSVTMIDCIDPSAKKKHGNDECLIEDLCANMMTIDR